MVKRTGGVVRYIGRDMKRVDGWLNPLTARVIAELGLSQSENGVAGARTEGLVHLGRKRRRTGDEQAHVPGT